MINLGRQTIIIQVVITSRENAASGVFIVTRLVTLKTLLQVQGAIEEQEERLRRG